MTIRQPDSQTMPPYPALFLPGLLCDEALWEPLIARTRGLLTPSVADLTHQTSMATMARAALNTMPDEKFMLFGLSMGGYVAFEIMRQAPERVTHLILFSTSARPDTPEQRERRHGAIALAQNGAFHGVTMRLLPWLLHHDHTQNPDMAGTVMRMARHVGRDAFIRQQTAILGRPDSRPTLPTLACPTLIIGGHDDAWTTPAILKEINVGIKGSVLHLLSPCAHLAPLEQPDEVARLVQEFL